ncbi:MAG: BBP7 family outer membrane beta-barrel protein [Pirellulaceae bacterium]|nr:BBP7 family outer membrane beta-barrel protein [Pirellulaceae bacterium]
MPLPSQTDFFANSPVAHQDSVVLEAAPGDNPAATDILPSPSDAQVQAPESYKNAMQQWGSDSCTSGACSGSECGNRGGYWFGSVGALILGSPSRHSTYLTYNTTTYLPVMQTGDVNRQFSGGVDVTVGKMFGCGNWGAAFTYWGIYPAAQQADIYNTSYPISSYLNFGGLDYNANPASLYWDNAFHQRVITNQAINSVEWNLIGNCGCNGGLYGCSSWDGCQCGGACGPRFGAGWMAGVRYFQVNDDFRFYSDNADNIFDGSANEIEYLLRTRNNLLGFQVGGGLSYRVWNCLSLYGNGKAGIYGNHAIVNQAVYGSAGDATVNVGPYAGDAYRFQSSQTSLAFLGQLDLGGRYQLNKCWSIDGGYRMVGVTGLALTDGQIPSNFAYLPDAQRVHASDCMILHGGYVGASFCW